mmetsp:Transcript_103447/g.323662  ORF Transcript_103447/g.323662 Transcript_103447/m.323662 type:complete len:425 (-) Transcript_103447:173-1447(-)
MGCSSTKATAVVQRARGGPGSPGSQGSAGASSSVRRTQEADLAEVPDEPHASRIAVALPSKPAPNETGTRQGPMGPRWGRTQLSESSTVPVQTVVTMGTRRPLEASSSSYTDVAKVTATYLYTLVSNSRWVDKHNDVAYYFKVPVLLADLGREEDARFALRVVARYADAGGAGSANAEYATTYPQCPWLWMCWAASKLGMEDLANGCFEKLRRYQHRITESGLIQAPYSSAVDFQADFMATAMVAKAALLRKRPDCAAGAGDALVRALEANRANMRARRRFSLRWSWRGGFLDDGKRCNCVSQGQPGQYYQMLGFPALVLMELARARLERSAVYRAAATEIVSFLKGCAGILDSGKAHVVAAAFAFAHDADMANLIASKLVSQQQPTGSFQGGDAESLEAMDGAAETAFWLHHVSMGLSSITSL